MQTMNSTMSLSTPLSEQVLERGRQSIAGGDSSTMRVLPYHLPLVAARGQGSRVWDVDGNEYIDLNMAYGPLVLGHCPEPIIRAVTDQIRNRGSQLGFPTEITIRVAEKIKKLFPSMELMRFANSGTEADVSAARLARAWTGRPKLIQFEGHYHGWSDTLFNRYHAPLEDLPTGPYGPAIPGTQGLNGAPHDNLVCRWNDVDALEQCLNDHRGQVAGVIMEPVMGNAGTIPPLPGYLETVPRLDQRSRRASDLRRSDHGHARGRRRSPGTLRYPARHHRHLQGVGRRLSGRRLRCLERDHATRRGREDVPRRSLFGQRRRDVGRRSGPRRDSGAPHRVLRQAQQAGK